MPTEIFEGAEVNRHKFTADPASPHGFKCVHCGMTDSAWGASGWGCAGAHVSTNKPIPAAREPIYPGGVLPPIPAGYSLDPS